MRCYTAVPVRQLERTDLDRPIHHLNWGRIETFYDLASPVDATLSIRRLWNLSIRSFVFVADLDVDAPRRNRMPSVAKAHQ